MVTKRIVCLANSRKLNGRCIAGREVGRGGAGPWVRPVSDREHQEVSEYERQYEDGSDPRILDVILVPLLRRLPGTYQTENWLLDPTAYWEREGQINPTDLGQFLDPEAALWHNGSHTRAGCNDRIPLEDAGALDSSLRLIKVKDLAFRVEAPGEDFGNPKRFVQARFTHAGEQYGLRVTDPPVEREHLQRPNGDYQVGPSWLTISLGEPYKGFVYKLVAAVIAPRTAVR